jgi:hypothetical protein
MTFHASARTLFLAASLLAAVLPAASAETDTSAPATFLVVHGIPGRDVASSLDPVLPVDVLVAGKYCLLQGFTFGSIAGPFEVPAGAYPVAISLANPIAPCSNAAVISATVTLAAGSTSSIVAALSAASAPTALVFDDTLAPIPNGDQRLMAHHAADAPEVKVSVANAGGATETASFDLFRGTERSAVVSARPAFSVSISPVGSTAVIGPVTVAPGNRGLALIYAVGSARTGSVTLISKILPNVF